MVILIILIIDVFFLLYVIFNKNKDSLLYGQTPEEQYAAIENEFNKNLKAIQNLDISDYKLGSGHIY